MLDVIFSTIRKTLIFFFLNHDIIKVDSKKLRAKKFYSQFNNFKSICHNIVTL